MREIKFRFWNKEDNSYSITSVGINVDISKDQLESYIVEQYTGLKDKNGKEIYEGDEDSNGKTVIFKNGCFMLRDEHRGDVWLYIVNKEIEIIGNIHENY